MSKTITFLLSTWLLASLQAEDWPGFRGPTGMGVSTEKALPLNWGGDDGKNVLWKSDLPPTIHQGDADHNQSSPIILGNRVFITTAHWPAGANRNATQPAHHVACYAVDSGKLQWDVKVPAGAWTLNDLRGGYAAATPAASDGRVFASFGSSIIHALDIEGKIRWSHTIPDHDTFDVAFPVSPVVYKDTVLLLLDRKAPNSNLVALDAETGNVRWTKERPKTNFGHMTPILTQVDGKDQMIVCASDELQGIDPNNGDIIWTCPWGRSIWPVSSPVVAKGLVYAIGGRGGHPGLVVDPSGAGDVSATHLKWKIGPMSEGLSSPVAFGEYVYRLNSPGVIRCNRIADGEELFKDRLPNAHPSVSPFVTPEGHIYFASAGKTVVIQAGPELKILAESDLGDASLAAAAVSNGRIFLKGKRLLYAIGNK